MNRTPAWEPAVPSPGLCFPPSCEGGGGRRSTRAGGTEGAPNGWSGESQPMPESMGLPLGSLKPSKTRQPSLAGSSCPSVEFGFGGGFPAYDLVTVEKALVSLVWIVTIVVIYYNKKLSGLRRKDKRQS